jgi:hypothetical protein
MDRIAFPDVKHLLQSSVVHSATTDGRFVQRDDLQHRTYPQVEALFDGAAVGVFDGPLDRLKRKPKDTVIRDALIHYESLVHAVTEIETDLPHLEYTIEFDPDASWVWTFADPSIRNNQALFKS